MYTPPVPQVPSNVPDVGMRIRRERDKAGLSLAQLADLTGLSKAYLVRLEKRGGNPSLDVLGRIADALEVTVADLVGGTVVRFELEDAEIPPSLRAYADEAHLTSDEMRTLVSIRWRRGEEPRTPDRWRYIHNSLRLSRSMDEGDEGDDEE
jgi:transcriptional regulator with XRE-family HTH domain